MMPCRRAIRCAIRIEAVSSVPSTTASTTLTAATTSDVSSAQPKSSTVRMPSVSASAASRIAASASSTSRKPTTSVSGSRSAASTGGTIALSAATIAATSSAPQKLSTLTPGSSPAATINATPIASHETTSENSRQRDGRVPARPRIRGTSRPPSPWAGAPAIASTARAVPSMVSGNVVEGEAPGCARATRTRSTRGRIEKCSGLSSISASPSMPAAIALRRSGPRTPAPTIPATAAGGAPLARGGRPRR